MTFYIRLGLNIAERLTQFTPNDVAFVPHWLTLNSVYHTCVRTLVESSV